MSAPGTQNVFADLLPPARHDVALVSLASDGKVWVRYRGRPSFELYRTLTTVDAALASVQTLTGQTLEEASPRCLADVSLAGEGGRDILVQVTALHPSIAPGTGFPAVTLNVVEPA